MKVTFTDETSALYVSNYSSALDFIGKEVLVDFREDIYKGTVEKYIAQLSHTSVTTVLDRETDMKLYTEDTGEIYSTISFGDVPDFGITGAIVFCTNAIFEKSDKSDWVKFTCLDRNRKSGNVRLFKPMRDRANFINRYIQLNIKKGKIDFITDKVELAPGRAPEPNPEIKVAKTFILDIVRDEPEIMEYINKTQILDFIEKYNLDEEIEPGYEMVRLAIEIEQIRNLKNVTKDLNISSMMKYAILRRGYCITNNGKTVKSKELQNLYMAIEHNGIKSPLEMCLIDPLNSNIVPEKEILEDIHNISNKLALVNRTYFYDRIK